MRLVKDTKSVFSGSQVLRFVDRGPGKLNWTAGDLDIYTTKSKAKQLTAFFEREGYKGSIVPGGRRKDRRYVGEFSIICVVTLEKTDGQSVDVVISSAETPLIPIARYYSTHVVNVITAYSISVAHPDSTLVGKGYLRAWAPNTTALDDAIRKYERRGYQLIRPADAASTSTNEDESYCPNKKRRFTDNETMRIPFPGSDEGNAQRADADILETVSWRWGGPYECPCCGRRGDEKIRDNRSGKLWCKCDFSTQRTGWKLNKISIRECPMGSGGGGSVEYNK